MNTENAQDVSIELKASYSEFAVNFDREMDADIEQIEMIGELNRIIANIKDNCKKLGLTTKLDTKRSKLPHVRLEPGGAESVIDLLTALGGFGGVAMLLKSIQPSLVQWLKNRASTGITIKTKNAEIKIQKEEDIEEAIKVLEKLNKKIK